MRARLRVHQIVEAAKPGDRASFVFDVFILSLIALNVLAVILASVPEYAERWGRLFNSFEVASVAVFSLEYLLRLWSCVEDPRFSHPLGGRVRFAISPMALIDALAIAPFFLPMVGVDLRFVRTLRLFRLIRIAKVSRYTAALRHIQGALRSRRAELITSLGFMVALVVLASSLLYYAERDAQPEHFGSIPAAMWWAIITLTTVGYGDIYPITTLGKTLAAIIAILGVGMVALPTSILASGFAAELRGPSPDRASHCPHCGRSFDL